MSSYCGLVDAKIRASDKDLPVQWPFMSHIFFYKIAKNWEEREKFFYVIAFDLIKILKS